MMDGLHDAWLIGTHAGIYTDAGQDGWQRLGGYQFAINGIDRKHGRVLAATGSGVWEVRKDRWIQRHDETLTEVMDVMVAGDSIIAASAYGIAYGRTEPSQATRWQWLSDSLPVNQRFTNTILSLGGTGQLVGTEGGLLVHDGSGQFQPTEITDGIRDLVRFGTRYLAATDSGIWTSEEGLLWQKGSVDDGAFALAATGDLALAGTEDGVLTSKDGDHWQAARLAGMRVCAVEISGADPDHWCAGGVPGGLWISKDGGRCWQDVPQIPNEVEVISAPEANRS